MRLNAYVAGGRAFTEGYDPKASAILRECSDGLAFHGSDASDSFEHLIPMSDSVFIVSEQPDKVVEQLSTFLASCFLYVAANYDCTNVIHQPFTDVRVTKIGNVERRSGKEKWT